MSFDSDEASAESSEPREYVDISINSGVTEYHHTSGVRDLQVGSVLYTAIPMMRSEIGVNVSGGAKELTLTLPIDHALARRYTQQGVPPKKITVTLWRKQSGGDSERIWIGDITSMACSGKTAQLRVPARAGEASLRVLPNVTASKRCPHVLYDTRCLIQRTASGPSGIPHKVTTTVMSVSGRDVRVDLTGVTASDAFRADWAKFGEFVHVASGERMTIRDQVDLNPGVSTVADLSLQMQIVGMQIGDSVEVYAGCDWLITTCNGKFANKQNFGGFPQMPARNPFVPSGSGVRGDL